MYYSMVRTLLFCASRESRQDRPRSATRGSTWAVASDRPLVAAAIARS